MVKAIPQGNPKVMVKEKMVASTAKRAWWAISGKKGKGSSRGKDESAPESMELDSLPVCDSGFRLQER